MVEVLKKGVMEEESFDERESEDAGDMIVKGL